MKSPINLGIDHLVTNEDVTQKLIENALKNNSFIQPVQVVEVDTNNLTVNVKPLILAETTDGEKVDSNVIYNVKYIRIQSGTSAIIIDPTVGDIGLVMVCDRDISTIKETKTFAMPNSGRIHSLSDSVYLCGFLNKEPAQYVKFTSDGIEIYSPTQIKAIAPQINAECDTLQAEVVGDTVVNSKRIVLSAKEIIGLSAPKLAFNGSISAEPLKEGDTAKINMPLDSTKEITSNGIKLSSHTHSGVESGSSNTGEPQ